jgi:transcription initiation factor IIE alpha subunit
MSEHDDHKMHDNSLQTYRKERPKLSRRAGAIYDLLIKGPLTDREIAKRLKFDEMNSVRPRITELKQAGLIEECGSKIDPDTGHRVRLTKLRKVSQPQGSLFP